MLLAAHPPVRTPLEDWREQLKRLTGIDLSRCPVCAVGTMVSTPLARKAPDDTS